MKNHTKIIEMGAEGGSITLYKCTDKKNEDWYFHSVNEMAYEDLDIEGTDKKSRFSMSLAEAFVKMQGDYTNVFSLYPLLVHSDYKLIVFGFLQEYINTIDKNIDYYQWANVLGMEEHDLKNKLD